MFIQSQFLRHQCEDVIMLIHYCQTIFDEATRNVAVSAEMQIMLAGTNNPATLFNAASESIGNSIITNELGIADFWIQPGEYRFVCGEFEIDNITISDATGPIRTIECPVVSGVVTIDLNKGGDFYTIADANITQVDIINRPKNGVLCKFEWRITQNGTGNFSLTPPAGTVWRNGAALGINQAANSLTALEISFTDGAETTPNYHFSRLNFEAGAVTAPTGGGTIDAESRAAINSLILLLQERGIAL